MDLLRYYAETADQVQRLLRVTANGDSCSWLERSVSFRACFVTSLVSGLDIVSYQRVGFDHAEVRMLLGQ